MPRGPKGEKRPADVVGNAVHVMKIATGEIVEDFPSNDGKDKAAQALGRKGGQRRAERLSANERSAAAQRAAAARWKDHKD
jgi:hypothetical protein